MRLRDEPFTLCRVGRFSTWTEKDNTFAGTYSLTMLMRPVKLMAQVLKYSTVRKILAPVSIIVYLQAFLLLDIIVVRLVSMVRLMLDCVTRVLFVVFNPLPPEPLLWVWILFFFHYFHSYYIVNFYSSPFACRSLTILRLIYRFLICWLLLHRLGWVDTMESDYVEGRLLMTG